MAEVEEVRPGRRGEGLTGMPRRLARAAVSSLAPPFCFYIHPLLPPAALPLFYLDWRRWRRQGAEMEGEA